MGGCHATYTANKKGIEAFKADMNDIRVSSVLAQFSVTDDGYAAFLQGYTPGRAWLWWYSAAPQWIDAFDNKLGAPLGPSTLDGAVYSRKFATGAVVSFDTRSNTGHFDWSRCTA